jgi:hypothetical protein
MVLMNPIIQSGNPSKHRPHSWEEKAATKAALENMYFSANKYTFE